MLPSDHMKEYLDEICSQVRWKKAHGVIRKELEDHLSDQAQAFEDAGSPPEKAVEMAVREMGDPVMIGIEFDRAYRPKINLPILFTVLILVAAGFLARWMMIPDHDLHAPLTPTIVTLGISAGILALVLKEDYTILSKSWLVYAGYIAGSLIVFLLSTTHGRFTLLLPYFQIVAVPIVCCSMIYLVRNGGWKQLWLCYLMVFLPMLLFSGGRTTPVFWSWLALILTLVFSLFSGAFTKIRHKILAALSIISPLFLSIAYVLLTMPSHRLHSLLATIFPENDPHGCGYMTMTIRAALSDANWIGPIENLSELILPISGVDYLLTWLICHCGWIALFAVLGLVGTIAILGISVYRKQSGFLARLVLCAVFSAWAVQMLSALIVNLGLINVFSYPFPFFGGNMALIFNSVLLGLLLSVCQIGSLGGMAEEKEFEQITVFKMYHPDNTVIRVRIGRHGFTFEHKRIPRTTTNWKYDQRKEQEFNR